MPFDNADKAYIRGSYYSFEGESFTLHMRKESDRWIGEAQTKHGKVGPFAHMSAQDTRTQTLAAARVKIKHAHRVEGKKSHNG